MVPTPVLYFASLTSGTGSGVMVTGSHNPPDYNGFKIMINGRTLFGDEIQKLHHIIQKEKFSSGSAVGKKENALAAYLDQIIDDIELNNPMKIAIDCGNGVTGICAEKLFESLGCEVIPLFSDVDGNFPNHHPDPSNPKNLIDLVKAVKTCQCDVGFAFDGDGDRVGVVTETLQTVYADRLVMLLAQDILIRNPAATIIYDVKCSRHLKAFIEKAGGNSLMCKTGHSFVKEKMRETGALLAGEMSGHIFFKERWLGFDDGLYTAARLLEIFAKSNQSVSSIFETIPNDVATPELTIEVSDTEKFAVIDRLTAVIQKRGLPASTIDGVRVDLDTGWGLVRCSNTTPNLVLRFEAESEDALRSIQTEIFSALYEAEPSLDTKSIW